MQEENKYTSKYLDVANTPLYPFGYGMSYTTFQYSPVKLNKSQFKFSEQFTLSVTVSNTGAHAGHEVVQLYVRDLVGSVTRPVKELKGFQKIYLDTGESKEVTFTLTSDDLRFYTADMTFKAEPGEFEFFVGGSSDAVNRVTGTLKQ
jgi:beta-glucosidase